MLEEPENVVFEVFFSHRLCLTAGRRISRPSYQSLNPFLNNTDAYTAISSNHTFRLPRQYRLLLGGEYGGPSVNGLFTLRASGSVSLDARKQQWQEKAVLSLKVSDLFYTDGWFSALHYQNINTDWVNRYDSHRLTVSFTYKLGGGKTHSARPNSSADEEGRAGY